MGQKYKIDVFVANKQGKVDRIDRYEFQIKPEFEVLSGEKLDDKKNKIEDIELDNQEKKDILKNIKNWLFQKTTTPIKMNEQYMWSCYPEFTDEDKEKVKQLYLMEEL